VVVVNPGPKFTYGLAEVLAACERITGLAAGFVEGVFRVKLEAAGESAAGRTPEPQPATPDPAVSTAAPKAKARPRPSTA
jgi:hypothetical protein